jgi:hypothetical protein
MEESLRSSDSFLELMDKFVLHEDENVIHEASEAVCDFVALIQQ